MAASYNASTSIVADNTNYDVTANGGTAQLTFTPPGGMLQGDLVLIAGLKTSGTKGNVRMSTTGGQRWRIMEARSDALGDSIVIIYCTFNGTWAANPVLDLDNTTGATNLIGTMHTWHASSTSKLWRVDVPAQYAQYSSPGSPFDVTITGVTTAVNAVAIAVWASADDNSWTLQTAGWANAGTAQYRNPQGANDQSMSIGYLLMPAGGATGNVTNRQSALGGDFGQYAIMSFVEYDAPTGQPIYVGSAYSPANTGTNVSADTNTTDTCTVTPPTGMQNGDLVYVILKTNQTASGKTPFVATTGGQTWNSIENFLFAPGDVGGRVSTFYCTFNGTWTTDPVFDLDQAASASTSKSAEMHVWRPSDSSKLLTIDVAETNTDFSAPSSPGDVSATGITTTGVNALAIFTFVSTDDDIWVPAMAMNGWDYAGEQFYSNIAGNDISSSVLYKVFPAGGATGTVKNRQTGDAGGSTDAGTWLSISFNEVVNPLAASVPNVGFLM